MVVNEEVKNGNEISGRKSKTGISKGGRAGIKHGQGE